MRIYQSVLMSWRLNADVFGYRCIWQLLRREGLHVNHKRVYKMTLNRGVLAP